METDVRFDVWLDRWGLVADGDPIITHSSRLLPVVRDGEPLMLKVAAAPEERAGAALMVWWRGEGAARVMEHEGDAILLERAMGARRLDRMVAEGEDDAATRVLCGVVANLHRPRADELPGLVPLEKRFRALELMAARHGGAFARSAEVARRLLATPVDVVALHGDMHHGNVLDFGLRGWLAIDPKGLVGERGFDYANLFCNPDHGTALAPGRLARQADVVANAAGLERRRLLEWIVAWAGLSAAWSLEDGVGDALETLAVAEIAQAEITHA